MEKAIKQFTVEVDHGPRGVETHRVEAAAKTESLDVLITVAQHFRCDVGAVSIVGEPVDVPVSGGVR